MWAELNAVNGSRRLVNPAGVLCVWEEGSPERLDRGHAIAVEVVMTDGERIVVAEDYDTVSARLHAAAETQREYGHPSAT